MTTSSLRMQVDFGRCEGHGLCVDSAPEMLGLSDEGDLLVLRETVPAGQMEQAHQAVRVCPVAALAVSPIAP